MEQRVLRSLTRMGTRLARFARRYPSYFRSRSAVLFSTTARALNPCFRAWGTSVDWAGAEGDRRGAISVSCGAICETVHATSYMRTYIRDAEQKGGRY